jgi:hypothetical protein
MAAKLLAYASITLSVFSMTFTTQDGIDFSAPALLLAVLSMFAYLLFPPQNGTHR